MQELQETATRFLRVADLISKRNPRRHMTAAGLKDLRESIKAQGILQPILVRPTAEGMEIVAGNRRSLIAREVLGDDYKMPVLVREMTDAEAEAAAVAENTAREDMTAVEEAEAAARILGEVGGDRDEAARKLGWSMATLSRRLALMNASQKVRDAHVERKISLGHAELLAAVDKAKQDVVLDKILADPTLMDLSRIKVMLAQISLALDAAIFDKSECGSCPHNSSQQRAFFSEAIADGLCTKRECYDAKTEAELESRRKGLEPDFQTARIVRPGENATVIKLVPDGPKGVGNDQAAACRACANFGAAVSAVPGKVGSVFKDLCFDGECNAKMVSKRIKAEHEAQRAATAEAAKPAADSKGAPTSGKGAKDTKAKPATGKAAKPAAPTTITLRTAIIEYRENVWREVYRKEIVADDNRSLRVLIALAMTGKANKVDSNKLSSAFAILTKQGNGPLMFDDALPQALEAPEGVIKTMLAGMAATAYENIEIRDIVGGLRTLKVDMSRHYQVDRKFLDVLTKSEIHVIAEEIGLKAAMGEKFVKTMAGKKDEIVKALLTVPGFEYSGKVPTMIEFESYFKK